MRSWLNLLRKEQVPQPAVFEISTFRKGLVPKNLQPRQPSASCHLKLGFCCRKGKRNARIVAVNHVAALYDCCEVKCKKFLVKASTNISTMA